MNRQRRIASLIFAGWLFASMLGGARAADLDRDGLDDALEDTLLQRYAPHVRLHPDEPNSPTSVDWILERSTMTFKHAGCSGTHDVFGGDLIDAETILTRFHPGGESCDHLVPPVYSNEYRTEGRRSGFALEFDPETTAGGPWEEWATYGHAYPGKDGGINLQYWFFFPFNDWMVFGRHQGDWEHIGIVLVQNQQPVSAVYSQHGHPQFWNWEDLTKLGLHPVVYTAKGSHASYKGASGGDCEGADAWWGPIIEHCSDSGVWWSTWGGYGPLVNVGERTRPRNGATWISYTGLWGKIGSKLNLQASKSGPEGPAFQEKDWFRDRSPEICNNGADDDIDGEIDENTDCLVYPDLVLSESNPAIATDAVADRVTVDPGESFPVRCAVENLGVGFGEPFFVGFVLSEDRTRDPYDIPLYGYLSMEGLPASGSRSPVPTWTVTVPSSTPGGNYWLIAKVDVYGQVIESDETNNVRASDIPIQVLAPIEEQQQWFLADASAPVTPLYRHKENFSDGVAQGFFPVWGTWDASPGAYFGTGEPFGMDDTMSLIASSATSYLMEFDFGGVTAPSPHGIHIGAVLRYTWIDEFLRLEIRQPVGQPAVMELVNVDGDRSVLATAPLEDDFFEGMHQLRIHDSGCHLTVELSGEVVLDTNYVSDVSWLERGFYVNYDNTFLFDNFVLEALPEIDADGDGFTACAGDCDDGRADAFPGAPETCGNARDDDCDGEIDEGCGGGGCRKICVHQQFEGEP